MQLSSPEPTTFDKLVFPKTVYKYREANDLKHRTILSEQIVFFAPANSFKDEFDCRIPYRYDLLTDSEIYDNYVKTLKEVHPEWDPLYLQQQATIWSNKGLLRDRNRLEKLEEEGYNELNEIHGILSLTAEPANIQMWKKYSANFFNGFCVGLDPKIMFKFFGGGGKVSYVETLPLINPTDSFDVTFTNLTYSKLNKWSYEKEYRTQKMWGRRADVESRKTKLPSSAYTELILGHNTVSKTREEIISEAQLVSSSIKISITNISGNKISMKPYT